MAMTERERAEFYATCAWRLGDEPRGIYAAPHVHGPQPDDVLIGLMDSPELAAAAVEGHNGRAVLRTSP